jgi:hypothetical protein
MFGLGLYLNFDPSHLLWLGIDPVEGRHVVVPAAVVTKANVAKYQKYAFN